MFFIVIFQKQLKELLNKTTKLRVQTNLDTRFKVSIKKVSIRKMSTYGSKQGAPGTNSGTNMWYCYPNQSFRLSDLILSQFANFKL